MPKSPPVIAIGFTHQDKTAGPPVEVVHEKCKVLLQGPKAPRVYYHPGAEDFSLKGRICAVCRKPFEKDYGKTTPAV
jgi:hypothetical protein